MGAFIRADSVTAAGGHVVTFISRVIADFYCCQALPITITRHIRLLLMSRVKNIPIPTNNTVTQEAFTVKYECFNLMECAEPICCLTYTTCSTVHIHSFHKKYIFVYTAFTLSYSRAAGGASSRMYGRPQNTSDRRQSCLILPAQLPGSGHVTSLHRPTPSLSSTSQQK